MTAVAINAATNWVRHLTEFDRDLELEYAVLSHVIQLRVNLLPNTASIYGLNSFFNLLDHNNQYVARAKVLSSVLKLL